MRFAVLAIACGLVAACAEPGTDEPETSAGSASTGAGDYDRWAEIARARGVEPGRRALAIGVRGVDVDGARHETTSRRAFDDLLIVLGPDRSVTRLAVSTHPWETHGVSGVPDVDGDGQRDVGMIRPGRYVAVGRGARTIAGRAAFDVRTPAGADRLDGTRDTDHDGVFTEAEHARSLERRDGLTAVLFHRAEGGAPPAVGCQVLSAEGMAALTQAVGGASATFDYVLVDAAEIE